MKRLALFLVGVLITMPLEAKFLSEAHTTVKLYTSKQSPQAGDTFHIALHFQIDPQWHLYWSNPGDSGMAPTIKWKVPDGLMISPDGFPLPEVISTPPLVTYGYHNDLWLTYTVKTDEKFDPASLQMLKADVEWLACHEECIPGFGELTFEDALEWNEEDQKKSHGNLALSLPDTFKLTQNLTLSHITLNIKNPDLAAYKSVYYFSKVKDVVLYSQPQPFKNNIDHWVLDIPIQPAKDNTTPIIDGLLVFEKQDGTHVGYSIDTLNFKSEPAPTTSHTELLMIVLFAFIGGMILNLMPCVFPVLSLKIMKFANARDTNHQGEGVAYLLGVLVSFAVLGLLLVGLRYSGQQIGWGFQLQSAPFVVTLVLIFHMMTLSLFGVFELGARLTTLSMTKPVKSSAAQSFFTGVLATVVATPCSAPFMGAALGIGLTLPWYQALGVFLSLGLGMALPFTVLCFMPSLLNKIPKPGRWMETLKQFLGFPMLGSVLWLLWVLERTLSHDQLLGVVAGLFIITFALWIYGRMGGMMAKGRYKLLTLLLMVPALVMISAPAFKSNHIQTVQWQAYDHGLLQKLKTDKKHVFIDFTARWCITCQVNKMTTLNTDKVQNLFQEHNVTLLRADWTNHDEEITQALASFGRNSIPLYVLIDKDRPEKPIILPEILTEDALAKALESLSKG